MNTPGSANPIPHLWFVITDPEPATHLCAVVSLTTLRGDKDQTVVLGPSDHPYISRPSVIHYIGALIVIETRLAALVAVGGAVPSYRGPLRRRGRRGRDGRRDRRRARERHPRGRAAMRGVGGSETGAGPGVRRRGRPRLSAWRVTLSTATHRADRPRSPVAPRRFARRHPACDRSRRPPS